MLGGLCFILIFVVMFLLNAQTDEAYISDMYVIDNYLIVEGHHIEQVMLQAEQEAFYFEDKGAGQYVIDIEHLGAEGYQVGSSKQTRLTIASGLVDNRINFKHKTFVLTGNNNSYTLIKQSDSVEHTSYEREVKNELGVSYVMTDFFVSEQVISFGIEFSETSDIYVGLSDDETNTVYKYEVVQHQKFAGRKKVLYQVALNESMVKTTRLYVRVLPKGMRKDKVKSQQLLLGELLPEPINPAENNIKVV